MGVMKSVDISQGITVTYFSIVDVYLPPPPPTQNVWNPVVVWSILVYNLQFATAYALFEITYLSLSYL